MRSRNEIKVGEYTLAEIIEKHSHWLNEDIEGWQGMRADLSDADLCDADLYGADLYCADLCNASLCNANLRGADLSDANLSNANLNGADLRGANLHGANLYNASLYDANLCNAELYNTNLCEIYLCDADLSNADLNGANLRGTNLYGVNGNLIEYRKGKILTEDIIGYKKCKNEIIVTLKIPRGAIIFSISGNKCRTNKAKVIAIDGADRALSKYKYMSYYVGDEFNIYDFDCQYNEECGRGIHFFMTRKEAEDYNY